MKPARLDAAQRAADLAAMDHLDLLVVGGGVVGAGAALDAATRGLSVGLVERDDFGSGTSSRSSRLAHGGLRYLEHGEFGLVHQALTERGRLLERLAPHLVRPVPFLLPLTKGWERPYLGAGVALYDALSKVSRAGGTLPGHRHLTRRAALRLAPGLRADQITGGIGFFDAQIDDVRHTLALVRTAATHGAHVAQRVEVVGLATEGGRVVGADLLDHVSGARRTVRAEVVLLACGVWTPAVQALLPGEHPPTPITPSKGTHLVVRRDAIDARSAIITRTVGSVLFLLPWGRHWIIGTTDTAEADPGRLDDSGTPLPTEAEVDYLLAEANRWLSRPLTRADVVGSYAGLRPLAGEESETTTASREHAIGRPLPGLITITGGKYTTYRVMAAEAVDAAVTDLPRPVGPSRTASVPLVGAEGFADLWEQRGFLAAESGLAEAQVKRLLRRYGDELPDLLVDLRADPTLRLPVHVDADVLGIDLVRAVRAEGAQTLTDVMARRTRLSLQLPDGARGAAEQVAALIGPDLGWDAERAAAEVAQYRRSPIGQLQPAPPAGQEGGVA